MSLARISLDELVALADRATGNALADPELLAALTPYAYDETALNEARTRGTALSTQMQQREDLFGQQVQATSDHAAAWKTFADGTYVPHVKLARIVFAKEPGTQRRLGLAGRRSAAFPAWVTQARQLYETAQTDEAIRTRLATKAIDEAALTAARAEIERLQSIDRMQEDLRGRVQQATRTRDEAAKALRAWMAAFRDTARVALRDHPDWLERLGFREPS